MPSETVSRARYGSRRRSEPVILPVPRKSLGFPNTERNQYSSPAAATGGRYPRNPERGAQSLQDLEMQLSIDAGSGEGLNLDVGLFLQQ
jgi:hypothetical protein